MSYMIVDLTFPSCDYAGLHRMMPSHSTKSTLARITSSKGCYGTSYKILVGFFFHNFKPLQILKIGIVLFPNKTSCNHFFFFVTKNVCVLWEIFGRLKILNIEEKIRSCSMQALQDVSYKPSCIDLRSPKLHSARTKMALAP